MKYAIGWLRLKPGKREEFMVRVRSFVALSRTEQGVLEFEVTQSDTDEDVTIWVEGYESEEAHQRHLDTPEHQALLADIAKLAIGGRFEHIHPQTTRTSSFTF